MPWPEFILCGHHLPQLVAALVGVGGEALVDIDVGARAFSAVVSEAMLGVVGG